MKKIKSLIILLMLTSLISTTPVQAYSNVVFSAHGKIEEYINPSPHAKIMRGYWNIQITKTGSDYEINFACHYTELNLGGEGADIYDQAVGKIDRFWLTLHEPVLIDYDENSCTVEGELWVKAMHWNPETLRPWWDPPYPWVWGEEGTVMHIDQEGISIEWGGLDIAGSTRFLMGNPSYFEALGRITNYAEYVTSSEVLGGIWEVKVENGIAEFSGYYRELNNDPSVELSPEGSVDWFVLHLTSEEYWFEDDTLVIIGTLHLDKRMVFLDDYTPYEPLPDWFDPDWIPEYGNTAWIIDFLGPADCEIRVTPDTMTYDRFLNDDLVYGTTILYKNLL